MKTLLASIILATASFAVAQQPESVTINGRTFWQYRPDKICIGAGIHENGNFISCHSAVEGHIDNLVYFDGLYWTTSHDPGILSYVRGWYVDEDGNDVSPPDSRIYQHHWQVSRGTPYAGTPFRLSVDSDGLTVTYYNGDTSTFDGVEWRHPWHRWQEYLDTVTITALTDRQFRIQLEAFPPQHARFVIQGSIDQTNWFELEWTPGELLSVPDLPSFFVRATMEAAE